MKIVVFFAVLSFLAFNIYAQPSIGLGDRSSGLGLSRDYNPAIGANLLLGGEYISKESEKWDVPESVKEKVQETGLHFWEAELSCASAVDPYFRADLILALHKHEGEIKAEVEEGYITTLSIPLVTIKAGKFYLPFGKHNLLHSHSYPFIDAPLANTVILGEHGLNEPAVEFSILIPVPWFLEVTGYVANGDNHSLFNSPKKEDLAYGGKIRNFIEISESTTIELGGSYIVGRNRDMNFTHVFGSDLTLRWRHPKLNRYYSMVWQTEYFYVKRHEHHEEMEQQGQTSEHEHELLGSLGGGYSLIAFQIMQRWWIQARFDALGYPKGQTKPLHRVGGLFAFVPSEYSALRLQYSYWKETNAHEALLQLSVSIGAHPAHPY